MSDRDPEVVSLCDRLGPYFDGELSPAEAARFERHLVSCARCGDELEGFMGLEAALRGRTPAARVAAVPARRRPWRLVAGGAALLAAAALAMVVVRGRSPRSDRAPAIALAPTRAAEIRVGAGAFAAHRPYDATRGAANVEAIPLAALAALEQRGATAELAAALALSGDAAKAARIAAALPADAADHSAFALLAGRPEAALEAADRALAVETSTVARWNRALAVRDLGLPSVAAADFDAVAAAREPGWSDEARARAEALRRPLADRHAALDALAARGEAMVAGGAPLVAADVERFAAEVRFYFFDAVRLAGDRAALDRLRPLAAALDADAHDSEATAAIDRAVRAGHAVRARFAPRYRALRAGSLDAAAATALVRELESAGDEVADLTIGALVASGAAGADPARLDRALTRAPSTWYALYAQRLRLAADRRRDRDVAPALEQALAACGPPATAFRCGQLALDLAEVLHLRGRETDAARHAERARALFRSAGAPIDEDAALLYSGEIARAAGRHALALAVFAEVAARAAGRECALEHYARSVAATIALQHGDPDAARTWLPAGGNCPGASPVGAAMAAVDLARLSGSDADRLAALAQLDAAGAHDPSAAAIGRARLTIATDAAAGRARLTAAIASATGDPAMVAALRAWGYSALLADAASRGSWSTVVADAATELHLATPPRCAVVASQDESQLIAVVVDGSGAAAGLVEPADPNVGVTLPARLLTGLAACPEVAVIARPPLHGRSSLLPPSVPWFFASSGAATAAALATPKVVVVADPAYPAAPRLSAPTVDGAAIITGADATPSRTMTALRDATYAELHVHGVADRATADGAYLLLAPDPDGRDRITADHVARQRLVASPVVVLAACDAAEVTPYLQNRWSLPDAFITAGARAVVAADIELPDRDANALFTELRTRILGGAAPAAALAAVRTDARWSSWAAHLMLFAPAPPAR